MIPKHKGTEGLQSDLKRKLSRLREAPAEKKAATRLDIFHVPRSGAGQVVLLGLPNTGKSSILAALTKAKVVVADFPFATQVPVPGMVRYEDVQIQVVDMPPITADYSAPGQVGTYRNGDLIAVVIDLSQDVEEQILIAAGLSRIAKAAGRREDARRGRPGQCPGQKGGVPVHQGGPRPGGGVRDGQELVRQDGGIHEALDPDGRGTRQAGRDAVPPVEHHPGLRQAARQAGGYERSRSRCRPVRRSRTWPVAIHRELAEKLKSARIWGTGVYDGQSVQLTHTLHDKDVVELHFG